MAKEDFTTYTEVDDTANLITVASSTHIDFTGRRHTVKVNGYLYKDYGLDYFGDFKHNIDVKWVSDTGLNSEFATCWLVSKDAIDEEIDIRTVGNRYVSVTLFIQDPEGYRQIRLCYWDGTLWNVDTYTASSGTQYYLTIQRIGTALTCKIYSDANRTVLLDTLTLTIPDTTTLKFRYLSPALQYGSTAYSTRDIVADIDNLEFITDGAPPTEGNVQSIGIQWGLWVYSVPQGKWKKGGADA